MYYLQLIHMDFLINKDKFADIWSDKMTIPIAAMDMVIFTIYKWELCIVLWYDRERFPNKYALPGGIVAKWFSLEDNFDTILERETWIKSWVYKEQLYTFWNPGRDDRWHVISISYFSLVRAQSFLTDIDFSKIDLVKYKDLDKIETIYDHKEIITYAKQRLRWKLEYTNMAKDMLGDSFRIAQLQEVYEIALWKKIDKRNFQKKIFKLKMIEETWTLDKTTNRPAKLYRFVDTELKVYEVI